MGRHKGRPSHEKRTWAEMRRTIYRMDETLPLCISQRAVVTCAPKPGRILATGHHPLLASPRDHFLQNDKH
jgi:hypothetical protein